MIDSVYPDSVDNPRQHSEGQTRGVAEHEHIVEHRGMSGIVLAVNQKVLVSLARQVDGLIEFVPRVGNFVPIGGPLFHLHGFDH